MLYTVHNQILIDAINSLYNEFKLAFSVVYAQTTEDFAWLVIANPSSNFKYCAIKCYQGKDIPVFDVTFVTNPYIKIDNLDYLSYVESFNGTYGLSEYLKKCNFPELTSSMPVGRMYHILATEHLANIDADLTIDDKCLMLDSIAKITFDCKVSISGIESQYDLTVENSAAIRTAIVHSAAIRTARAEYI